MSLVTGPNRCRINTHLARALVLRPGTGSRILLPMFPPLYREMIDGAFCSGCEIPVREIEHPLCIKACNDAVEMKIRYADGILRVMCKECGSAVTIEVEPPEIPLPEEANVSYWKGMLRVGDNSRHCLQVKSYPNRAPQMPGILSSFVEIPVSLSHVAIALRLAERATGHWLQANEDGIVVIACTNDDGSAITWVIEPWQSLTDFLIRLMTGETIRLIFNGEEDESKFANLQRGLTRMATSYPHFFANLVAGVEYLNPIITDVLLQCTVLGGVYFNPLWGHDATPERSN